MSSQARLGTVVLLSADPWDAIWRRNQHLATQLVTLGLVDRLVFVNPAAKLRHVRAARPIEGIVVVTPHLVAPRHRGGNRLLAWEVRRRYLAGADAAWINDPVLGARCLVPGMRAVYDVTDDWRSASLADADLRELVTAENTLSGAVSTVVCSEVLRERWHDRYGVQAPVIHNGVDVEAHAEAVGRPLPGREPRFVYVGTLHDDRLDVDLLVRLAAATAGSVHLVGPDHLSEASRLRLSRHSGVHVHGPVRHEEVPSWMAGADALICPHRVTPFTLSLDAIKSFEYLASGRPVYATPTSGFQELTGIDGVTVVDEATFVEAAVEGVARPHGRSIGRASEHDWSVRAIEFAAQLQSARRVSGDVR